MNSQTQKYELIFSELVNTEKFTKEFLIVIKSLNLFSNIIFRGDYKKTLVVVYAEGEKETDGKFNEEEDQFQQNDMPNDGKHESQSNEMNLSDTEKRLKNNGNHKFDENAQELQIGFEETNGNELVLHKRPEDWQIENSLYPDHTELDIQNPKTEDAMGISPVFPEEDIINQELTKDGQYADSNNLNQMLIESNPILNDYIGNNNEIITVDLTSLPSSFCFANLQKSLEFSLEELKSSNDRLNPGLVLLAGVSNINPALFFETEEIQKKDEVFEMASIEKLDKLGIYLRQIIECPSDSLDDQQILTYFSTLNESIFLIKSFIEKHQSQVSKSYFFENNYPENNKIPADFCDVIASSIRGDIGSEIEQSLSFSLLNLISNCEIHVNKLSDFEFIRWLLTPIYKKSSAGIKLFNLYFDCFYNLIFNKKFREIIFDQKTEVELKKHMKFGLLFANYPEKSDEEVSDSEDKKRKDGKRHRERDDRSSISDSDSERPAKGQSFKKKQQPENYSDDEKRNKKHDRYNRNDADLRVKERKNSWEGRAETGRDSRKEKNTKRSDSDSEERSQHKKRRNRNNSDSESKAERREKITRDESKPIDFKKAKTNFGKTQENHSVKHNDNASTEFKNNNTNKLQTKTHDSALTQSHQETKSKKNNPSEQNDKTQKTELRNQKFDDQVKSEIAKTKKDESQAFKKLEKNYVYKINFNCMLKCDNNFQLKKFKKTNDLMTLCQFIAFFSANVKIIYQNSNKKKSELEIFENNFFYLKQFFRGLKTLTAGHLEQNTENFRVNEEYKTSFKRVFNSQNNIKELLSESLKAKDKILSCSMANMLKEERFFDYIVLYLSSADLYDSDFFELTFQLVCRKLFYVCNCKGGIAFIVSQSQFIQSLLRILKVNFENDIIISQAVSENGFNSIFQKDVYVYSKLIDTNCLTKESFLGKKCSKKSRISILSGQFYYFFLNINTGITLMDKLSFCLASWDNHQEILIYLSQIDKMFFKSCLSRQAMGMILREQYFMNILILLLKVEDLRIFDEMRFEISIVCKILYQFLKLDKFKSIYRIQGNLIKVLDNLETYVGEYSSSLASSKNDKVFNQLVVNIGNLKAITSPFAKINEDFVSFVSGFQACSRYTHTNIATLLTNKQHFSNVEREFPKSDMKKYLARINDYLLFFKTSNQQNNKIIEVTSYLKIILFVMKSNKSIHQLFVTSNLFDIVNFLALVAENVLTIFMSPSEISREVQRMYQDFKNDLVEDYLDLFNYALKVLVNKTSFKEKQDVFGKEYENVDLFYSVITLITNFKDSKPNYLYELCTARVFELKEFYEIDSSPMFNGYSNHKFVNKLKSFCFSEKRPIFETYLTKFSKQKVRSILAPLIKMLSLFSKFPGSYDTLFCELLYLIFTKPSHREVYFIVLAVFISEPRKYKHREKIKKIISALLFEKVKNNKRSLLVIMQKYGCNRQDSMFDLYISENWFSNTIEYLIFSFLTSSDQQVLFAFSFFLMSLIEWKENQFCQMIALNVINVFKNSVNALLHTLGIDEQKIENRIELITDYTTRIQANTKNDQIVELDRILHELKVIGQVCNSMYLMSLTGTLKIFWIEENVTNEFLLLLLAFKVHPCFEDQQILLTHLCLKLELIKLLRIFMNSEIGFQPNQRENRKTETIYTDIPDKKSLVTLVEFLNNELDFQADIKSLLRKNGEDSSDEIEKIKLEIFYQSLELLKLVFANPISKNIACYSECLQVIEFPKEPLIELRTLVNFIFRFVEDSPKTQTSSEGQTQIQENDRLSLNLFSAQRLVVILEVFLQSALFTVTKKTEEVFMMSIPCWDALSKIFFKGKNLLYSFEKLEKVISKLRAFKVSQDLLVKIEMILDSLFVNEQKFDRERRTFERNSFQIESIDIRSRLARFSKATYRFEHPIEDISVQRGFLNCQFQHLNKMLETKILRIVHQTNFCKENFIHQIRYFLEIECELKRCRL